MVFLAALALLIVTSLLPIPGAFGNLESVPDLEKEMYLKVESFPCVRLLNLSGGIGCSNPGHEKIIAPIVRLDNSDKQLSQLSAVLITVDQMEDFFLRVAHDRELSKNVAGVLVESSGQNRLSGFSPAEKFPQAAFAPYRNTSYDWNPAGSSIMWNAYNFPVFLLSDAGTIILQEVTNNITKSSDVYPANVAEFDLVMQTTTAGSRDSESCLNDQSCLPLGGHSVWSSLPPINISLRKPPKPIIMAVASQDSASFFRDQNLGADSPISGLIALLTAVDALSRIGLDNLKRQLVFAVFTGEAWGYLGSRKLLHELDMGSDAVNGLNSSMIEQVLEIGSVGKGLDQGHASFYAHASGNSPLSKDMLSALQSASASLGSDDVKVRMTTGSNPGVPPSSLMAFLNKNSSTSGVVLEDFDSSFSNRFYHSHLDNPSNINSSSIAAAAALVARALYIFATGDLQLDLMTLNSIRVNVSLVEELVGCLLTCQPGLSCDIVKKFISPTNECPSHYVGVFLDLPSGSQHPQYADDTTRFVWNFLADRTSRPGDDTSSCSGECSNAGEVCVHAEVEGGGRCVKSTTRYVPAYSTRLKFEDNLWHVLPANPSDHMGTVDPIWTESFWNTIGLRVYKVQSTGYDRLVLVGGMGITIVSYIVVVATRACLLKAVKRD